MRSVVNLHKAKLKQMVFVVRQGSKCSFKPTLKIFNFVFNEESGAARAEALASRNDKVKTKIWWA